MNKNKEFEEYECLLPLIGIDLVKIIPYLAKFNIIVNLKGYNKEIGGVPEDLVAFMLGKERSKNKKGPDFGELGECKSVKLKPNLTKRKLNVNQRNNLIRLNVNLEKCEKIKTRESGNPIISTFNKNVDFFESNVWEKSKKIIYIFHRNNIIDDIKIFDGEKYKDFLFSDDNYIKNNNNADTQIFTHKLKTNTIQMKLNMCQYLSDSIIPEDYTNNIINQDEYINNLLFEKVCTYKYDKENKQNLNIENKISSEEKKLSILKIRKIKIDYRMNKINNLIQIQEDSIRKMKEMQEIECEALLIKMSSDYLNNTN